MPSNTPNLGLIVPGFNEYTNSWWQPLNTNWYTIDTSIGGISAEIVAARGSQASLSAFLLVGHNADGSLKAAPEVARARISPVYGFLDANGNALPLSSRLTSAEYEIFQARRGQATLLDAMAFNRSGIKDMVLQGTADNTGAPTWLGSTSATANIDGQTAPLYLLIGGYTARVRTLKSLAVTGSAGTRYLYANYQAGGAVTVDGSTGTNGQTSVDTSGFMTLFTDTSVNFTTVDVQPGDTLTLLSSNDAGKYVVAQVAPNGVQTQLQILGTFPVGGLSSINYQVQDSLGVTLTTGTSNAAQAGRLVIGELDFDGTAITAVRPRQFKDVYNSPWTLFNLTSQSTQQQIFNHYLGSDILDVEIQVSQANDGSQPVEALSLADVAQNTAVTVVNGQQVAIANTLTFSPGSSGATLTGGQVPLAQAVTGSLSGNITATAGAVTPSRSVACQWDRNRIYVKNATPSFLYKDYNGVQHQTGYVRVVVRKRG